MREGIADCHTRSSKTTFFSLYIYIKKRIYTYASEEAEKEVLTQIFENTLLLLAEVVVDGSSFLDHVRTHVRW